MVPRTDLAAERHFRLKTPPSGIKSNSFQQGPVSVQRLRIETPEGAAAMDKPIGDYRTLTLPEHWETDPELLEAVTDAVARELSDFLPQESPVLVAGLGNRAVTPDALGPLAADRIAATRHLRQAMPELFSHLRQVSVLSPGVLGTTGIETAEILESLAERIQPACLLVLDALCAADSGRLCNTVQLCDTGITPGEGTGTARCRLDRETLGIPVIALGIPTVTDVSTLVREQTGMKAREPGWLVTRSDIDGLLRHCVNLVSRAVNLALHPGLSAQELALLLES